jgi:hypothetical protein
MVIDTAPAVTGTQLGYARVSTTLLALRTFKGRNAVQSRNARPTARVEIWKMFGGGNRDRPVATP